LTSAQATKGKEILESSYEFLVCSGFGGLRLGYNNYFDLYEKVMERHKKGEHVTLLGRLRTLQTLQP
jgi:hypothetical protein